MTTEVVVGADKDRQGATGSRQTADKVIGIGTAPKPTGADADAGRATVRKAVKADANADRATVRKAAKADANADRAIAAEMGAAATSIPTPHRVNSRLPWRAIRPRVS